MWIFILAILLGAYAQTIVKLAILQRKYRWGAVLLFTLPVIIAYPQAAAINLKNFDALMSDFNTLSTLCIAVIIQEAIVLMFGAILLRRYYMERKIRFWEYVVLLPSLLYPAGCFFGLVWLFNNLSGISFGSTAVVAGIAMAIATGSLAEILKFIGRHREELVQWAAMLSLAEVAVAMFLPVVLSGNSAPAGNLVNFNLKSLSGILFIVAMVIVGGLASRAWFHLKRKIFRNRMV